MRAPLSLLLTLACICTGFSQDIYDRFFTGKTLRLDYFHTGTKGEERFSLGNAREEGPWPGSRVNLVDTLNLGEFLVRVADHATNAVLYSRGFSSMFNEWQSTDEAAAGVYRTFSETVRFPFPRRSVQVSILRRDKRMVYHEMFTTVIDPQDPSQVRKDPVRMLYPVAPIMENGDPATKVDIVILGDGYARGDMEKFRKDARHFNDVMFSTRPFKERKNDFNVRMVEVESHDSGIPIPGKDVWKSTPLGTHYDTFGSARYVLTEANEAVHDAAAEVPYDFICILVNDSRYGGGGIFQLYTTTYTKEQTKGQEWQMDYVYVHEFGHCFAGLADEYYTSSTAYNDFYPAGVEPWEPNITALLDPKHVKWSALLTKGIPVPTPWDKAAYDSLEVERGKLDRLAPDYYQKREPLYRASMAILKSAKYAGEVGAFEGAGYATKGLYRPSIDCRMFSLSLTDFDPVCSAAIGRMIDFYAK